MLATPLYLHARRLQLCYQTNRAFPLNKWSCAANVSDMLAKASSFCSESSDDIRSTSLGWQRSRSKSTANFMLCWWATLARCFVHQPDVDPTLTYVTIDPTCRPGVGPMSGADPKLLRSYPTPANTDGLPESFVMMKISEIFATHACFDGESPSNRIQ